MSDLRSVIFDSKAEPIRRLVAVLTYLRSEEGCAWDRKQTHRSLLPYLIEETYEVVESIENGEPAALCEELGDLLCQIVFHAQLAREAGEFTFDDVARAIVEKLIARHPHVFDQKTDLSPKQVRDQWEKLKIQSGEKKSVLSGIPRSMPALSMAFRIGEKAGGVGFDWNNSDQVLDKVSEELDEIRDALEKKGSGEESSDKLAEEIGDLLFATASFARKEGIDPEMALKHGLDKFCARFDRLEAEVVRSGRSFSEYTLEELESLWQSIKT